MKREVFVIQKPRESKGKGVQGVQEYKEFKEVFGELLVLREILVLLELLSDCA